VLTALAARLYARFEAPWHVLGWVMLVPWFAALERIRTLPQALAAGVLCSVVFELAVFDWFAPAIDAYATAPPGTGLLLLGLLAPWLQPQCVATAVAWRVARSRGLGWGRIAVAMAGAYVGSEWLVPKLFGDTLGYGLWPSSRWRQGAELLGVSGLTVVLVLANVGVLAVLQALGRPGALSCRMRQAGTPAGAVLAMVASLTLFGSWRLASLRVEDAPLLRAGIVQGALRRYDALAAEVGTWEAVARILDTYLGLSDRALTTEPLELLVWPETVYPTTFGSPKTPEGGAFDRVIANFVAQAGVPLVFGTYDREGEAEFNAAAFLEPPVNGRAEFATYRKASLFPLTERVPAVLDSPRVRRWLPWLGTWQPGRSPEAVAVRLPGGEVVRVAPLICYDALEPRHAAAAVADGADLIVTLSNDSWFDAGAGPWMHLVGAAFRSIETRRPQVRATNTGVSAVIDATGELRDTAGVDEARVIVATVPAGPRGLTTAVRFGPWLGPLGLGVAGATLFAAGLAFPRRFR